MSTPARTLAVLDQLLETLRSVLILLLLGLLRFTPMIVVIIPSSRSSSSVRIPSHTMSRPIPIFPRVKKHTSGRFPISARSSGFLVKPLERFGYVPMHDEPYILLIDSHPEGRGRDDDIPTRLVGDPFPLAGDAVVGGETGVVGRRADVVAAETGGESVAVGAEGDVYDARNGGGAFIPFLEFGRAGRVFGAPSVDCLKPGEEIRESGICFVGCEADFVVEIWAGGACCEDFQAIGGEIESRDYVLADGEGGGCGEANYGDGGKSRAEVGEMGVCGAEIVAPF